MGGPHILDGLEEVALQQLTKMGPDPEMVSVYLQSIAISLKRIADTMEQENR